VRALAEFEAQGWPRDRVRRAIASVAYEGAGRYMRGEVEIHEITVLYRNDHKSLHFAMKRSGGENHPAIHVTGITFEKFCKIGNVLALANI